MLKSRHALALAGALCFASHASAQWWWPPTGGVSTDPTCPRTGVEFAVNIGGEWPDSCPPNILEISVRGDEIDLVAINDPPPGICLAVITNWSLSVSAPRLETGTYTVFARHEISGNVVQPRTLLGEIEITPACPPSCPADCDASTGIGTLDVFDFLCFQDLFVSRDQYACDFDTSTGQGVCDVFDFLAFQDAFVGGCP
jgi:hypothetical protein